MTLESMSVILGVQNGAYPDIFRFIIVALSFARIVHAMIIDNKFKLP